MASLIVLISGPVGSGKTTLAQNLERRFHFKSVKTSDWIRKYVSVDGQDARRDLQLQGERLDRTSGGDWVRDALVAEIGTLPSDVRVVVDAVRTAEQIESIRSSFGHVVVHIHLTTPDVELERRYLKKRAGHPGELSSYYEVSQNATEHNVNELGNIADVLVDTNRSTDDDVLVRVASCLGLYGKANQRLVDVIVGGQYGSEGKGHVASYLARDYSILIPS